MDKIIITVDVEAEDIPVRGNALASGDVEKDREAEDEILSRLDFGDQWAWCLVIVRARFGEYEGRDVLGGCSYKDQADFQERGGYYEDMKKRAIEDLKENMEAVIAAASVATAARFAVERAQIVED